MNTQNVMINEVDVNSIIERITIINILKEVNKYLMVIEKNFEFRLIILQPYVNLKNELRYLEEFSRIRGLTYISRSSSIIADTLQRYKVGDISRERLMKLRKAILSLCDYNLSKEKCFFIEKLLRNSF